MTCIVGLAHEGKVTIGGDSAGVDERYALQVRTDRKVFANGELVMGFTTSFRMGQLLAFRLKVPKRHPNDDLMTWMVNDLVDAIRDCLKQGGYAKRVNEVEEGGAFLVGVGGRLFSVQGDYQVGESSAGYDAVGCGDLIALGSLHATAGDEPELRVRKALDAAERFSAGVRAPFQVLTGGEA